MTKKIALAVLIFFATSFLAGPVMAEVLQKHEAVSEEYVVGAGDVLDCHILVKDSDISMDYTLVVYPGGSLYFPGVGKIYAAGRTVPDLKKELYKNIKNEIKRDFNMHLVVKAISSPNVLTLAEVRPNIYVYGEVKNSGRLPYVPGGTLSYYVSLVGGPTDRAALGEVTISRQINGEAKEIKLNLDDILKKGIKSKDIVLQPGDVINVPRNVFYIADFTAFMSVMLTLVTVYSVITRR
jgi:polysaccharide biosynthesis/export protein